MSAFYEYFGLVAFWTFVLCLAVRLGKGLWTSWLGSALGFGYNWRHSDDAFAVVTGATDGIGLEYAKFLAKKGYNLLLISRTQEKLDNVRKEILAKYSKCKEVRTLAVDFGKTDIYEEIASSLKDLPVDVLVNNVGISYPYAEYLTKLPQSWKNLEDIININIVSCTRMCHFVLPVMEQQKRGLIINISSFSASYPTPLLSAYGASKTFVDYFSRALQMEYENKNIVIQSVLPAYVSTKMSKIRHSSLMVPSPATYVNSQAKTIGLENRTYGYWTHKLQGFALDHIVVCLFGVDYCSRITFNSLKGVRAKVYKKFELKDKSN